MPRVKCKRKNIFIASYAQYNTSFWHSVSFSAWNFTISDDGISVGHNKSCCTQTAPVECCDINVEKYVFYAGLIVIFCLDKTSWFKNELRANRINRITGFRQNHIMLCINYYVWRTVDCWSTKHLFPKNSCWTWEVLIRQFLVIVNAIQNLKVLDI